MALEQKTVSFTEGVDVAQPTDLSGSQSFVDEVNTKSNIGLTTSVGASALTVTVKQKDGSSDPSASAPIKASIKQSDGAYELRSENTAAATLSITVPSGATLGHRDATEHYIYVYLLDNSATPEIALASFVAQEESTYTTTTISAGADLNNVIYSTTGRTTKYLTMIGRLTSTQANSGTWVTPMSDVSLGKFEESIIGSAETNAGQSIPSGAVTTIVTEDLKVDTHNGVNTSTGEITIPVAGDYVLSGQVFYASGSWTVGDLIQASVRVDGTAVILAQVSAPRTASYPIVAPLPAKVLSLSAGAVVTLRTFQNSGGNRSLNASGDSVHLSVWRVK